jgi:two-component system response regulator AtoC
MSLQSLVLVVDDDDVTRTLLREVLQKEGYYVQLAESGESAIQLLRQRCYPVIISDVRMAEVGGISVLRESKKLHPHSAVILMTGFGSMEGTIQAIQEGAFDYVSKPFRINDLKEVIDRAFKHWTSLQVKRPSASQSIHLGVGQKTIIGRSPKIVDVYKVLARAALSASTVFIVGESGTGKELIARAIHDNSDRKNQKFVALNCGALSENLLESELFGHVKGAFTGATADKKGVFEHTQGGTLFLDEIGDISPSLQVKLLRVLQEEEFKPVGSNEVKRSFARVIAATHHDLETLVKQGRFREDLYYRLKVISIELPPLRERMEDLPQLVDFFLLRYANKNKKIVSHVSQEAMDLMTQYSWPGNIRELEHAIESAVAMTRSTVLFPEDFPSEMRRKHVLNEEGEKVDDSLEHVERLHILRVLQETQFNKSRASELLGIDRATLYRKAQRYGINLRARL